MGRLRNLETRPSGAHPQRDGDLEKVKAHGDVGGRFRQDHGQEVHRREQQQGSQQEPQEQHALNSSSRHLLTSLAPTFGQLNDPLGAMKIVRHNTPIRKDYKRI